MGRRRRPRHYWTSRSGGSTPSASLSATLEQALDTERAHANRRLDTATRLLVRVAAAGVLGGALASVLFWRALAHWVLRPLDSLGDQTRQVTAGEFDRPIEPVGPPEIMTLAADTDAMRRRIRAELAAVEEAREQLAAQAEELARSNADLEQFAYVASHDLQEPLRKVTSFCQLLQRRYQGPLDERADQYIEFAVDGAKRMQALINDLLAFSRVGRTTEAFEPVDCDEPSTAPCATSKPPSTTRMRRSCVAGPLPMVEGDPSLLAALFQNLIANALKFRGDAPPRVEVSRRRGTTANGRSGFADNGIGIDEPTPTGSSSSSSGCTPRSTIPGRASAWRSARRSSSSTAATSGSTPTPNEGTAVCWTLPVPAQQKKRPKKRNKETPH